MYISPPWTELRDKVFLDRYALKDVEGKPVEKSVTEMFQRVAQAIGHNPEECKAFYDVMQEWRFIPGGRILTGAGTNKDVTYFNCFVIPVKAKDQQKGGDSRSGIMDTIASMLEINSRGGGVGVNWSTLRPRGAYVRGVGGTSSGSVSWMESANAVAAQVEQGGSRRAALMFMLCDWHPDIEEFISVKKDHTRLTHANLSVAISDEFMEAVANDRTWKLVFPETSYPDYDTKWDGNLRKWRDAGYPVNVYKEVPARQLWQQICYYAWENGEPGIVFLERYNKEYNASYCSEIIAVNPCGELGLEPYGVCCLGAINLVPFYISEENRVDMIKLRDTVRVAVRFLDNVLEHNHFSEENKAQATRLRRIGVGTMGLADLLILLDIRYGSPKALDVVGDIYSTIADAAYTASAQLAKEKGPFPAYDKDCFLGAPFVKRLSSYTRSLIDRFGIRNATLLTQAPTGTTSILAGVSSGIEPNFAKEYTRRDRTGEHVVHHWLADHPTFVCAYELTPEEHVRMQATIQRHTDSSIAKTVNAPKNHTVEEVVKLYELAYALGCKGVTYYREGSREGVLVIEEEGKKAIRPEMLTGFTKRAETPLGRVYVTINSLEGKPFELFANVGKAGSDVAAFTEAVARLISLALRSGVPIEQIARQLVGIGGTNSCGLGVARVTSIPDVIGKILSTLSTDSLKFTEVDICPSCGVAMLIRTEGCRTCQNCGFSLC